MKSFQEQCLNYILKSFEHKIILPTHSKIDYRGIGKFHYNLSVRNAYHKSNNKPHRYIDYLIVFMLFDSFMENRISELINKTSYDKRLNFLTEKTKSDIYQKEFYRYIIIIRNSIVHHLKEIEDHGESLFMDYEFQNKKNSLKISVNSINSIISYIAYIVKNEVLNNYYNELIIEEYYKRAIHGIEECYYKGIIIEPKNVESNTFIFNRDYMFIKKNINADLMEEELRRCNLMNQTDYIYQNDNKQFIIPASEFNGIEKMLELNSINFI